MGCYFLLQGILLPQGSAHTSCTGRQFSTTEPPGKPFTCIESPFNPHLNNMGYRTLLCDFKDENAEAQTA